jgi:hypothetical protein
MYITVSVVPIIINCWLALRQDERPVIGPIATGIGAALDNSEYGSDRAQEETFAKY